METGSPRKIQFTVPLLDTHLDPEAAEQVSRRTNLGLRRFYYLSSSKSFDFNKVGAEWADELLNYIFTSALIPNT